MDEWKGIVVISAGGTHILGVKPDGNVVSARKNRYDSGQSDVDGWKGILAISAGGSHSVGLKADGTVVAVGENENGQCNVTEWKDIKAPNLEKSVLIAE